MSSLKEKIIRLIAQQGPLDISQFMALSLADPEFGYYKTANPFGRSGDFTTAPEVSQMFGEMVAVWVVATWQALGSPHKFNLCEMGPGRGTLMDDVLRTIKKLAPLCLQSACITLVETSDRLENIQHRKLESHGINIKWVKEFTALSPLPLIVFANELFDCLPIHQYVKTGSHWRERVVGLDDQGILCFATGFGTLEHMLLPEGANHQPDGTIFEVSPARSAVAQQISMHIAEHRGAALLIDYGEFNRGFGDTLQAISAHKYRNVLENPGKDDLTSHVDFFTLNAVALSCNCHSAITTQGEFLIGLGLLERAGRLGRGQSATAQQNIVADVERLAGDNEMGRLFKVLCIADRKTTMLPFSFSPSFVTQSPQTASNAQTASDN